MIKAIRDMRLGNKLLGEVVTALRGGYIPDRWRDMRVVLIPKPGRDLTQTKNWRPLNFINSMGSLGRKWWLIGSRKRGARSFTTSSMARFGDAAV